MVNKILFMALMLNMTAAIGQVQKSADTDIKSEPKKVIELARQTVPKPDSDSIKVIINDKQIIEEYRQKGELVRVKVIPEDGVPYYIDPQARHKRTGAYSDLINSGVEPVYWVIKRF